MTRGFLLWWVAVSCLVPNLARGDGKVFPRAAVSTAVEIPDQRALIHFADGTERLVVETAFVGRGTNFVWVMPVPSTPKIEAVSRGLFPTLQTVFQPQVIFKVRPYFVWMWTVAALVWLGIWCLQHRPALLAVLYLLLAGGLVVLFLLPSLATAKARSLTSGLAAAVQVLARERVGIYDVTTITSKEPDALLRWLQEQGFAASPKIIPVVRDYVAQGWVFVLARLAREADDSNPATPHPLAFTFKTDKPVYPLRLTGVENPSCRIDLYVFGLGRARVPGFKVVRCEKPSYPVAGSAPRFEAGPLRIRHAQLAAFVTNAAVATKLSAELTPAEMNRDAEISWTACSVHGATVYTSSAAIILAANFASGAALLGWVLLPWLPRRWHRGVETARPWQGRVLFAAAAAGMLTYALLPKISAGETRYLVRPHSLAKQQLLEIGIGLLDEVGETNQGSALEKLQALAADRAVMPRLLWNASAQAKQNVFTGDLLRFEDSPGNISFRASTNNFELIWHDWDGAEELRYTFQPPP